MARYLNPAKIGLLALIEVYVEGAVPADAILPVLSFVTSHLLDSDIPVATPPSAPPSAPGTPSSSPPTAVPPDDADRDGWARADATVRLVASIREFEQVLSPFAAAVGLPGRRLWDVFLGKMWSVDSLHALHEFLDRCGALLGRTKAELGRSPEEDGGDDDENEKKKKSSPRIRLYANSPWGVFVRRSRLEFARLRFDHATALWKDFVRYRQPTAAYWKRRHPSAGRLSFDSVLLTGEHQWGRVHTGGLAAVAYGDDHLLGTEDRVPVSTDDVEKLLEFQVEQMQKSGSRVPPEMRAQLGRLLRDSPLVPSLSHYVSFLDAWRAGDYSSSFDALHRYFDYTMQTRDRPFYHYALLTLAVLQADMGCREDAVAAMLEAVSTAKEAADVPCLHFALHWLFHLGRAHPRLVRHLDAAGVLGSTSSSPSAGGGGRRVESLAYLRAKARESGMWALWSSALLSEAQVLLAAGGSVARAAEHLVRSSQILVERNLASAMAAQMSMAAALWDRLGVPALSVIVCETFLRCHGATDSSFEDRLRVTARLAGILAARGRYDDAFAALEAVDATSPLRSRRAGRYWHETRALLRLRRELHRGRLDAAETLLAQLDQAAPDDDLEPELGSVLDALRVDLLVRRGDLVAASDHVDALLLRRPLDGDDDDDDDDDISVRVRLLLTKARLLELAGRAPRGLSVSLHAARLAWRARLVPHLWQALGAVANVLVSLAEFAAAARLLVAVLPRCLEGESEAQAAELYGILADAYVGCAGGGAEEGESSGGGVGGGSGNKTELLTRAKDALDAAFAHFAAAGDVEGQCRSLAKGAAVLRVLGDEARAEEYAARYLALRHASEG